MAFSVGRIIGEIELQDRFSRALEQAASIVDKISPKVLKLGQDFKQAGDAMTFGITLPLAGAAAASTSFSNSFQDSMTKLVTLSGVSEESVKGMRDGILALGPAVGVGPNKLAEAMLVVTSTGIRGAEAMDILTSSAKATAVGLGDTNSVARAVTAAMNSYGKENLSAAQATDILYRTVKAGGAEATELAGVLGRVTGVASQVGVSFEEVGTFIATFTRLGVNASEATTSMGAVMSTLLKPTNEARDALKAAGTSIEELRATVKNKGLTEAMLELTQTFKGNDEQLAAVIPNIRALRGVMGTAGAQGATFKQVLRDISDETDTLDNAFTRTTANSSLKWAQFWAKLESVAIGFGDRLAPAMGNVLDSLMPLLGVVEKLVMVFGDLPEPIQLVAIAALGVVAAIGPLLSFVGRIIIGYNTLAIAAVGVSGTTTAVTASLAANTIAAAANTVAVEANAVAKTFAAEEQLAFNFAAVAGSQALLPLSGSLEVVGSSATTATTAVAGTGAAITAAGLATAGVFVAGLVAGALALREVITAGNDLIAVFKSGTSWADSFSKAWEQLTARRETWFSRNAGVFTAPEKPGVTPEGADFFLPQPKVPKFEVKPAAENWLKFSATGFQADMLKMSEAAKQAAEIGSKSMTPFNDEMKKAEASIKAMSAASRDDLVSAIKAGSFGMERLKQESGLTETAIKLLQEQFKGSGKDANAQSEAIKDLAASHIALNDAQMATIRYQAAANNNASTIAKAYKMSESAVQEYMDALKRGTDAEKGEAEMRLEIARTSEKATSDYNAKHLAEINAIASEKGKEQDASLRALVDYNQRVQQLGMTQEQRELAQIDATRNAEVAALRGRFGVRDAMTDQTIALIDELAQYERDVVNKTQSTIVVRMNATGVFTREQLQKQASDAKTAYDQMLASGKFAAGDLEAAWKKYADAMQKLNPATAKLAANVDLVGQAITNLGSNSSGVFGAIVKGIGGLTTAWGSALKAALTYLSQVGGKATSAQKAGAFIDGVAAIAGATGSGSTTARTVGGAAAGASAGFAIGAALAPATLGASLIIGPILGASIGALAGWIRGMSASAKETKAANAEIATLGKSLVATYGSLDNASALAAKFGLQLDLTATGKKGLEKLTEQAKALDNMMKLLAEDVSKYGLSWADIDDPAQKQRAATEASQGLLASFDRLTKAGYNSSAIVKGMSGDLNQMIINSAAAGVKIPAQFKPIIETLIRTKGLSEEAAAAILGIAASGVPSLADIKDAADRYGLTLDQLGPKVQQLSITDQATQIVKDFKLFQDAGADTQVVMLALKDKVQSLVTTAIASGLELPESMKPLIQSMIDAGLLVDPLGNKLTGLGGLKFAKPLSEAVDDLITKLDELIDTITKNVTPALTGIGRIRIPPVKIPYTYEQEGPSPPGSGSGSSSPATAPPETPAPSNPASPSSAQTASQRPVQLNVTLDGRRIARGVVPYMPDELEIRGV